MSYTIILTTVEKNEDAKKIAKSLLQEKLAACIQINKIDSIYNWKDKIYEDNEFLLYIKAPKKNYEKIEKLILKIHPYELPQITMIDITKGYKNYLKWIDEVTI